MFIAEFYGVFQEKWFRVLYWKDLGLCALDLLPLTSTLINGKVSSGALLDVAVIRTTQIMGNYVLD